MLEKIFELEQATPKQVILKVKRVNNLTIAMFPFIQSTYDYITVTRGEDHILTVIKKDGTTFSFHWGNNGHTLISENTERLKTNVCDFIENYCDILLDWDCASAPTDITILMNEYFNTWQFTCRGYENGKWHNAFYRNTWADCVSDMVTRFYDYFPNVDVKDWIETTSANGHLIWKAVF